MPVLFAALSSLLFGSSDFTGGFATRRAAPESVVFLSHLAGLAAVLVLVLTIGSGEAIAAEMWWGAAAGIVGVGGLVVLYLALATTPISVAAPVTAVVGAIVPVLAGVTLLGERPSGVAWLGIAVAVPAVALASAGHGAKGDPAGVRRAVMFGAVAGALFGVFGVFMENTTHVSGMWPLVAARAVSIPAVAVAALVRGRPLLPGREVTGIALVVGVMDMSANAFYIVALRDGLLSLVSVISSMYPVVTVALAWIVLRERITALQGAGLTLAALGIVLIAVA